MHYQTKKNQVEEENQLIWDEINQMRERVPKERLAGVAIDQRDAYYKDGEIYPLAQGVYTPNKNLSTTKAYKGPVIQALKPTHVQDKLTYKDIINEEKMSNMELFRKHHEMAMRRQTLDGSQSTKHNTAKKLFKPPLNPMSPGPKRNITLTGSAAGSEMATSGARAFKSKHNSVDLHIQTGIGQQDQQSRISSQKKSKIGQGVYQ